MPELPEVELCRRNLVRWCEGRRIDALWAQPGTPLRSVTPERLARDLVGRRVRAIDRRGKQLFVQLDRKLCLLVHLGMTGRFVRATETPPHARIRLELDDGESVHFVDPRRFGRVHLVAASQVEHHPEIAGLGPDFLELITRRGAFAEAMRGTRSPIKLALLDQTRVAGVGNIYAAEGLFGAGIDPFRPASTLSGPEYTRLGREIAKSMRGSLARDAGDEIAYVNDGEHVENPFRVYGREGERCPRCKQSEIQRVSQGARSTFFCPRCQPGSDPLQRGS